MTARADAAEIKAALEEVEAASQTTRAKLRKLHNLLGQKLAEHAPRLGLTAEDVIALGGGTPKDEELGGVG
jgi:hypothetical protein